MTEKNGWAPWQDNFWTSGSSGTYEPRAAQNQTLEPFTYRARESTSYHQLKSMSILSLSWIAAVFFTTKPPAMIAEVDASNRPKRLGATASSTFCACCWEVGIFAVVVAILRRRLTGGLEATLSVTAVASWFIFVSGSSFRCIQ